MKYCKNCQVKYDTPLNECLLCDSTLQYYDNKESVYKFTTYKKKKKVFSTIYKISLLINTVSMLTVLYLDYTINLGTLSWSLIVITANVYLILVMTLIYSKSRWISKIILLILLTAIAVIIIGFTIKDYMWALNYVLPFSLISNLLIISFLLIFNRSKWIDYVAALLLISTLGILSILMVVFSVVTTGWPTVALFFHSIATIIALLLFSSKDIREDFVRRFHT